MKKYGYLNGKIVDTEKTHLFLDDIGILRGFGVFDFFRIYNKKPFLFDDHFKRFQNSAKLLGLKVPISKSKLEKVLQELIKKNKDKDYHVRMVLTGGRVKDSIFPTKENFYILFEELKDLPNKLFKDGASIMVFDHQRAFAEAKTLNYMQAVKLQKERIKNKAVEILYIDKGYVLETTTSNIFIVKNKTIITPKEDILKGITRKAVISLAKKRGYKVEERKIKESELYKADEVFLTATNKKVLPIVKVGNKKISNGKVGEIGKILLEDFEELIRNI